MRKRRLGKDVKREVTPEFVNMSKEILYPQIQGVTRPAVVQGAPPAGEQRNGASQTPPPTGVGRKSPAALWSLPNRRLSLPMNLPARSTARLP